MLSSLRLVTSQCSLVAGRSLLARPPQVLRSQLVLRHAKSAGTRTTTGTRRSLKDVLMAPAGDTAFTVGKGVAAGSAAFGLASLCYYGLGLSKEVGAFERSMVWPDYVRSRIHTTYGYFGASILAVAGSAVLVLRSPALLRVVQSNSILVMVGLMAGVVGASSVTHSLPYQEGKLGAKQVAWLTHCGLVGSILAPLAYLGGPILLRAGLYTAGICGALSLLAVCAPSEKFLNMAGPISIGLGFVLVASLGSMFLPATSVVGSGLNAVMLYGGLVVFSGTLLFHTQHAIHAAEHSHHYDPINQSMGIYMSVINIFIRMVMILAGGGSNKRR